MRPPNLIPTGLHPAASTLSHRCLATGKRAYRSRPCMPCRLVSSSFSSSSMQRNFCKRLIPVSSCFSSTAAPPAEPTRAQYCTHFVNAMVPMIGFGFMDNLIMIQAGEWIDTSIGVTFGLSTLTAAAVGQIFSDMSGVCFGGFVGHLAGKLGLPGARLTPDQQRMDRVRLVGTIGRMVGVLIGCLLGMTSLLVMDLEESQRLRRFKELQPILATIARHTKRTLRVASCRIYLLGVDAQGNEALFEVGLVDAPKAASGLPFEKTMRGFSHHYNHKEPSSSLPFYRRWFTKDVPSTPTVTIPLHVDDDAPNESPSSLCVPSKLKIGANLFRCVKIGPGTTDIPPSEKTSIEPIVSYVARTGQAIMCIRHDAESPNTPVGKEWASLMETGNGQVLTSNSVVSHTMMCYPVFDDIDRDRVIGVIEVADKETQPGSPRETAGVFTREDERLIRMLSEHLSLYLALGSYYRHEDNPVEELETIEKIGWICPESGNLVTGDEIPSTFTTRELTFPRNNVLEEP